MHPFSATLLPEGTVLPISLAPFPLVEAGETLLLCGRLILVISQHVQDKTPIYVTLSNTDHFSMPPLKALLLQGALLTKQVKMTEPGVATPLG